MPLLICLSAKPVMSRSLYYVTLLLLMSREVISCCVHYANYHYCYYYMNPAMYSNTASHDVFLSHHLPRSLQP